MSGFVMPSTSCVSSNGSLPASASFPSGHAATAFAAAVAVGMIHPRLRLPLLALATLVAVSRVYLGVHYATDVTSGTALGAGWAVLLASLFAYVDERVVRIKAERERDAVPPPPPPPG